MENRQLLWHGGVAGLRRGDILHPGMEQRCIEGCPICDAHRAGDNHVFDPSTPAGWVYATSSRIYGRFHASKAFKGDLYRVRLLGAVERSREDLHFPTWRAPEARIEKVVERRVILTMKQRRHLFHRWGGSDREFDAMVLAVGQRHGLTPSNAV